MKKICMRIVALMCAAVLMFIGTGKAAAAERQCSITVCLADLKTTSGGVGVTVYQVGELKSQDNLQIFLPIKGLEEMSAAFTAENLNLADASRKTAEELAGIADQGKLEGQTVNTDTAGVAAFTGLEPGIYLVKQSSGEKEYGVMQPFLAVLPHLEEESGELLYHLDAFPKAQAPAPTTAAVLTPTPTSAAVVTKTPTKALESTDPAESGSETESTGNTRVGPKTGDDSAPMRWMLLLLAAGITVVAAGKSKYVKDKK